MGASIAKAQWEWKSNQEPFSSEEEEWTAYTPAENMLIEKAFRKNLKEIELGDYIVYPELKYQRRKDDPKAQRDIRRNKGLDQNTKIGGERYVGVENPRSQNNPFGDLLNFLTFFQNRSPEMKEFGILFDRVESSQDLKVLNEKVRPILIKSLKAESKKLPEITADEKRIFRELKQPSESFEAFYSLTLKIYTMNGFVYHNLNLYLRNEDWFQIYSLLPYAYCLFKTFFHLKLFVQENEHYQKQIITSEQSTSMTVYRGTRLDETDLSLYCPTKNKLFSWNSVTSTSTDRRVAKHFTSLREKDPEKLPAASNTKPVIFIIEIPMKLSNTMNANWISVIRFSALAGEKEIILAPGSVFEITQEPRKAHDCVEIHLKMIVRLEKLIHQGHILPGTMHTGMVDEDGKAQKILCLEGEDFEKEAILLKGNKLVEEVEFGLCKFNQKILQELSVAFKHLSQLKKLVLISPSSADHTHWSMMLEDLKKSKPKKLEAIEIYDRTAFAEQNQISFVARIGYFTSLTSLKLDFTRCDKTTDEAIEHLCSQGIRRLTRLNSLDLNFERCSRITDTGIKTLSSKGIRWLTRLEDLALNFAWCDNITDEGLCNLNREGISHLSSLKTLKLNFTQCIKITDKGLNGLCRKRRKLSSINLSFAACLNITDFGLKNVYPKNSKTLKTLILDFENCYNITNQGFAKLFPKEIKHPELLTSLSLNFTWCGLISDHGLSNLGSEVISRLVSLRDLSLDFSLCDKITDTGLKHLFSGGIHKIKNLDLKNVNCAMCPRITKEWTKKLEKYSKNYQRRSIKDDKILRPINFKRDVMSGSSIVKAEPIARLATNLEEIIKLNSKDELLGFLASSYKEQETQAIKNFEIHTEIFIGLEKFLDKLLIQTLSDFAALESLNLKFSKDDPITSGWLEKFCSQKNTSITNLTLNFSDSDKITDAWLSSLTFQNIVKLTSLTLIFADCSKITDKGLRNLQFKQINFLTSLELSFERCHQITDQGLRNLCSIRQLSFLASINLNFSECNKITEEGLNDLCSQGIKYLDPLSELTLNFKNCSEISAAAYENFRRILQYFRFSPQQ